MGMGDCGNKNNLITKVESVYTTPKIFGVEFENPWRIGVRLFIFTSYYEAKKV